MTVYKIDINMDIKCKRCGKGGATQGGYCLSCVLKNMEEGKYDYIFKKYRAKPQKKGFINANQNRMV